MTEKERKDEQWYRGRYRMGMEPHKGVERKREVNEKLYRGVASKEEVEEMKRELEVEKGKLQKLEREQEKRKRVCGLALLRERRAKQEVKALTRRLRITS